MSTLIRLCPQCGSERPAEEIVCEGEWNGRACHWSLIDVPLRAPGGGAAERAPSPPQPTPSLHCPNGHPVGPGDVLCLICGEIVEAVPQPPSPEPPPIRAINGWRIVEPLPPASAIAERFIAESAEAAGRERGVLWLYRPRMEPDASIYPVLQRLPGDHVPRLLSFGREDERAYEVWEIIEGSAITDIALPADGSADALRTLVDEIGRALASLAEAGLRHRDLRPQNILVRSMNPLDLVISGFGSARLSDFDLEIAQPLETSRYAAPEAVVGTVSAASDWWSFGVILLERLTRGACFEGINERAFLLHVVTRGLSIPDSLDPAVTTLLRGLLTRDPSRRWQWPEVRRWLDGEVLDAPTEATGHPAPDPGPMITLAGITHASPEAFALAAAEAQNWEEAIDLFVRGAVATWLEERKVDGRTVATVRRFASDEDLGDEAKFAFALMAINPNLPLSLRGEIVTPGWLLSRPAEGYDLLAGRVVEHLKQMGREAWLVRLRSRADAVRARAAMLEIELDEDRLRVALLATSRSALEAEWARTRRLFPDTDHAGVASLIERRAAAEEDLIILVSAALTAFVPAEAVLDKACAAAAAVGISDFGRQAAAQWFERSRREIYEEVDRRIHGFARCDISMIDAWADSYRLERRLELARALVLLAVPADAWKEPPKQQYIGNILNFFERRVASSVQQGPLVRLTISRNSSRVDLCELQSPRRPAEAIADHLLSRTEVPVEFDPAVFVEEPIRESRLRRLVSHAVTFRRDTGINGLYLGFPFVVFRDTRSAQSTAKPRIAPVLLWPIRVEAATGARGSIQVAFDREREEVRFNPALEGIFGTETAKKWREAMTDVLSRSTLRVGDVMDIFGALAEPKSRSLTTLPTKDMKLKAGESFLSCSAVLFHSDFSGQAIAEDLRAIARRPIAGTALEVALRVSSDPPKVEPLAPVPEVQRYFTAESDPSQEEAVFRARQAPGLLVEGPPGTGKSQTIVNIIADSIGRHENILVVCQKQAALRVVQKRLEAEGLGDRLFIITDVNSDRGLVLRALRAQLDRLRRDRTSRVPSIQRERQVAAARIEALEAEINRHHRALHVVDDLSGVSYRALIGELIALEAGDESPISAPSLRSIIGGLERAALAAVEDACAPLAPLWLAARYERSVLEVLKPFATDIGILDAFGRDFLAFVEAEQEREAVFQKHSDTFDIDDPTQHRAWLDAHEERFRRMPVGGRRNLAAWIDHFRVGASGSSTGRRLIATLEELACKLGALDRRHHDDELFDTLAGLAMPALKKWLQIADRATAAVSFFGRLNPVRFLRRRKLARYLAEISEHAADEGMAVFRDAAALEIDLRSIRKILGEARKTLSIEAPQSKAEALDTLIDKVAEILTDLRLVAEATAAINTCPHRDDAEAFARAGDLEAFEVFVQRLQGAFARHEARQRSLEMLCRLDDWFVPQWISTCRSAIVRGGSNTETIQRLSEALPTVATYQQFRTRAAILSATALKVFAVLRECEEALKGRPTRRLGDEVRRTIAREARLAWKARLETSEPTLLIEPEEMQTRVTTLADEDERLRRLNQDLLAEDVQPDRIAANSDWDDITRLTGPRSRRLREVIERGVDFGLMRLRPVWLMNPDVVSRVLPLKPDLFDVVIFDEASQLQVEFALPALCRARRMVVSGDEKQMPPTSFFVSRLENDEDDTFDGEDIDETATEAERLHFEETWNRREIKDCPDLLALARTVLPSTTLQIHYRSKYRELIAFSNAAFYGGRLSVPARHPDSEILRAKPIEVVPTGTSYVDQTNPGEAERVADLLADIWFSRPAAQRPSVGIVTFNRKQTDLINDIVEVRAEANPAFRCALEEEMRRTQSGEDMGFFVKNLENVQGDERDVIIFSTTFGRDEAGGFRRHFGVIGQRGGERRLNVAVTRAREKIILVSSLPIQEISDHITTGRAPRTARDYLQAYLDYATKISNSALDLARTTTDRLVSKAGRDKGHREAERDGFVSDVGAFIRSLGYEPIASVDIDAFSLDFAIEDPRTGLFGIGVECDAPRHDLLASARSREIWRPKVLQKGIPCVHRVGSRGWYHDRRGEQQRLHEAITSVFS